MAVNEYGIQLDRNGYAPSIISNDERCYICKRTDLKVDRHEIFHGPYRTKSKALGCWCYLCHGHHMMLHQEWADLDITLKQTCQEKAMNHYEWDTKEFLRRFGKNYI